MHLLLLILKTVGIILLILLGIILLLLLLILLMPICYGFEVNKPEENTFSIGCRVSIPLKILRFRMDYEPKKGLRYKLKVAWHVFCDSEKDKEGRQKEDASAEPEKTRDTDLSGTGQEVIPESEAELLPEPDSEYLAEAEPEPEALPDLGTEAEPEALPDLEPEPEAEPEPPPDLHESVPAVSEEVTPEEIKGPSLVDRILDFLGKTYDKIINIDDKIEEIETKIERTMERITRHPFDVYLACGIDTIKKLLWHIRPRTLEGAVDYGLEDPYNMGKVTGYVSFLYPLYAETFTLTPHFGEDIFKGHVKGKGRAQVGYLLYLVIRLLAKKEIRQLIRMILKGEL